MKWTKVGSKEWKCENGYVLHHFPSFFKDWSLWAPETVVKAQGNETATFDVSLTLEQAMAAAEKVIKQREAISWKEKKYVNGVPGYTKKNYELYKKGEVWKLWQMGESMHEVATTVTKLSKQDAQKWADQVIDQRGGSGQTTKEDKDMKEAVATAISEEQVMRAVREVTPSSYTEAWYTGLVPLKTIERLAPDIKFVYISGPKGARAEPNGKPMLGAALYNDGHLEMRWFIGGECPWFVYNPKAKWPEGYEQYGAFLFPEGNNECPIFIRKELSSASPTHKTEDAPEGYLRIPFGLRGWNELEKLSGLGIKTKDFSKK